MRVVVLLEPDGELAARMLGEWSRAWGAALANGDGELDDAEALAALLDLKCLCYDRGLTVNVSFPDNN